MKARGRSNSGRGQENLGVARQGRDPRRSGQGRLLPGPQGGRSRGLCPQHPRVEAGRGGLAARRPLGPGLPRPLEGDGLPAVHGPHEYEQLEGRHLGRPPPPRRRDLLEGRGGRRTARGHGQPPRGRRLVLHPPPGRRRVRRGPGEARRRVARPEAQGVCRILERDLEQRLQAVRLRRRERRGAGPRREAPRGRLALHRAPARRRSSPSGRRCSGGPIGSSACCPRSRPTPSSPSGSPRTRTRPGTPTSWRSRPTCR